MSFFYFNQNNSGGGFDSIGYGVIIEADNAQEANEIAEAHGIYFDGCAKEMDCDCCGDRWSRVNDSDATEFPTLYDVIHTGCGPDMMNWNLPTPIFYKDGRKENFKDTPSKLDKELE